MQRPENSTAVLVLTVRPGITVLPRCLQILSRRGYMLTALRTTELSTSTTQLTLTLTGPPHWQAALPNLMTRLVEVLDARWEET
jgi:hypothetical protein